MDGASGSLSDLGSPASIVGLLALSFVMLATSAIQCGNMPNAPIEGELFARTQRISFLLSNVAVTAGIIVSWLSLQSLTA